MKGTSLTLSRRHARACPGHPRRAAAQPVPERAAAVRCALRHGPAWVAGTSPARTAGRRDQEGDEPHALPASCPGLSRAPTRCRGRTRAGEGRSRSVRSAARSGVGGRDKPGHDGETAGRRDHEGDEPHALPSVMPGPVPGTHAVPRPDPSRRGPQPFGAPCGTVRRGWPGQARPGRRDGGTMKGTSFTRPPRHARACPGHPRRAAAGPGSERAAAVRCALRHGPAWVAGTSPARTAGRRDHEGDEPHALPASCPGLSRAPTPCRGPTRPGGGRSRSVRSAARSGVDGRDKPGHDGGTAGPGRGRASRAHRVMPGPVPGTHAVRRPDPCRRGPEPFGARCGTVRRGWPGQARPGRRDGGTRKGTSLTRPPRHARACPGHPRRAAAGPVPERAGAVRCALRHGPA